jgi:hypothetical protein
LKSSHLFLLFGLLLACKQKQSSTLIIAQSKEAEKKFIDSIIADRDQQNYWDVIDTVDVFDQSTEGGELLRFKKKGMPLTYIQTLFGEMGKTVFTFHLYNNKLVFASQNEIGYTAPIFESSSKVATDTTYYVYYAISDTTAVTADSLGNSLKNYFNSTIKTLR